MKLQKNEKYESEIPQVPFSIFSGNYNNLTYENYTSILQWCKNSEMLWQETEKQRAVIT